MDKLQEEMIIAYVKELSLKDTLVIPDMVKHLEIMDILFYYSRRAIEAFQNKDASIKAIFTVPAHKEGLVSSPFGNKVIIELLYGKFIKGL
jgi:hypothetical protein